MPGLDRGIATALFCLAMLAPLPGAGAEIEFRKGAGSHGCVMRILPDQYLGDRIMLEIRRDRNGEIQLDARPSDLRLLEWVAADRRIPFRPARWDSDGAFLASKEHDLLSSAQLHVTGRDGGQIHSAAFLDLDFARIGRGFVKECPEGPDLVAAEQAEDALGLDPLDYQMVNWILHERAGGTRVPEQMPSNFDSRDRAAISNFARAIDLPATGYLDRALFAAIYHAGGFAISPIFDETGSYSGGVAAAKIGPFWGLLDGDGWAHRPSFEEVKGTNAGLMPVARDGKWGVLSKTGLLTHSFKFDEILSCRDTRCPFRRGERWGYLDGGGSVAIPAIYREVNFFREGRAAVRDGTGWLLIDKSGRVQRRFDVKRLYSPSDGLSVYISRRDKRGFIAPSGAVAVSAVYDRVKAFTEGLAAVRKGKLWGFVDGRGREVIRPQFRNVSQFGDGLAAAQSSNGRWGYIDKRGNWQISPRFLRGFTFREGIAIVRAKNPLLPNSEDPSHLRRGFIDTQGRWIYPPIFEDVYTFGEGRAPVKVLGKWGYLDLARVMRR